MVRTIYGSYQSSDAFPALWRGAEKGKASAELRLGVERKSSSCVWFACSANTGTVLLMLVLVRVLVYSSSVSIPNRELYILYRIYLYTLERYQMDPKISTIDLECSSLIYFVFLNLKFGS